MSPSTTLADHVCRAPAEQRVIVQNVSWATYEKLLADLANQSSTRLTYDRGTLEIMSPLPEHERYNRILALSIEMLADAMGIDVETSVRQPSDAQTWRAALNPIPAFMFSTRQTYAGKP